MLNGPQCLQHFLFFGSDFLHQHVFLYFQRQRGIYLYDSLAFFIQEQDNETVFKEFSQKYWAHFIIPNLTAERDNSTEKVIQSSECLQLDA